MPAEPKNKSGVGLLEPEPHFKFQLAYEGSAVDQGTMDVYQLAPALIALGDLFKESNAILNKGKATVGIRVTEHIKRGSFELTFVIDQTLIDTTGNLFSNTIRNPQDLAILLGVFTETGGLSVSHGLIQFLKLLKGEKPSKDDKGRVTVNVTGDGNTVIINPDVTQLYESGKMRRAIDSVTAPVNTPGVDRICFSGVDNGEIQKIEKNERPYFMAPAASEEPATTSPGIASNIAERDLELVSPVFKKSNKWRFTDGNATFHALMADQDFLAQVHSRVRRFAEGDILRVSLQIDTTKTQEGLKTQYTIIKVLDDITPQPLFR
ncbi:MAG: hypothetical protein OEY86_15145 [Nitrospira sp.]|nr:hypothetical protein [Nitrospira sp.]